MRAREPDENGFVERAGVQLGGCRLCHSRHWPCATIDTIHRVLRDPDGEFVRLISN